MNRPYIILFVSIAAIALGAVAYAAYDYARPESPLGVATTTEGAPQVRQYGEVTLALGESALFENLRVTPLSIIEDSRCPTDVQCIQAGTVRADVEIVSGMGTSTNTITLGNSVTTEAEEVLFASVAPETRSGQDIAEGDYRLTFFIEERDIATPTPTPAPTTCYVGGCSMHLCSDRPDIVSTCEYRESYACYRGATCERQPSGECGWTETNELKACLLKAE
ncbi:MAG TPA: hypothetical protein VEA92_02980 [Candidatus Paceibacterota bacterium]|nr:hypothetical protein [Candidatus Paceibacterota bacterium]